VYRRRLRCRIPTRSLALVRMNKLTLRLAAAVDFNEQALYCVAWQCDPLTNHQVVPPSKLDDMLLEIVYKLA
jgi:hypothetical protein